MIERTRRLSQGEIANIIDAWQAGHTQKEIAELLNLSQQTVGYHIRRYVGAGPGEHVKRSGVTGATMRDIFAKGEDVLSELVQTERKLRGLLAMLGARRTTGDPFTAQRQPAWTTDDETELERVTLEMRAFPEEVLELSPEEYPADLSALWQTHQRLLAKKGGDALEEDDPFLTDALKTLEEGEPK